MHPGFRANHAKGIVGQGTFKASPEAAGLSKAAIFSGDTIPVTIRFSDSGGLPNVPDGSPLAVPHGLAIKFHLKDGSETDMVINSLKFFPVATGEDFRDLLLAIAASPPNAPQPTKLALFVKTHPRVPLASPRYISRTASPTSNITASMLSSSSIRDGKKQAFRYIAAPEKLVHISDDGSGEEAAELSLRRDRRRASRNSPWSFHLEAQLAAPGDVTKDPTIRLAGGPTKWSISAS